ncbi:cell division protein ZapA [Sphingomonas sp. RHCKR7]|uniref:cell division protein ZapA n=1 Tax=Sphingomonas folli TaxID=2862497 RepID=UPI001C6754B2|nr:cell division protein ZapA [Sphingomonas folli]MBW6525286.1 cell division protein ZapA [Sphingomonas folli]
MARVTLRIGETSYDLGCGDGGEARLMQAAALIDERWDDARRAAGAGGVNRTMLLAALMVADSLIEAREAPPPETPEGIALDRLSERLEKLAAALEQAPPTS